MKKLTLLLLATLAAHHAQASTPSFTGFYAGIAGGGTVLDVNIDQDFNIIIPGLITLEFPIDTDVQGNGAIGWINLGYSHQFSNHFVLAAEATAGLTNTMVSHLHEIIIFGFPVAGEAETKLKNDFALLFKPGYVIKKHTQAYAFVGPRWGNFDSSLKTTLQTNFYEDKTSGYELGITAGAGIEFMFTDRLSFGIEYAYTSYGEISSPKSMASVDLGFGLAPAVDATSLNVSTNTVAGQLVYHF